MQTLKQILGWIITLLVPVILVLGAVRILLTPLYYNVEYRLPYFPDDYYGFTQDERLYWAGVSVDYLLNDEGIEFLGDQQLDADTPLYNQRELRHMLDVKNVVRGAMWVLWSSVILVVGYGIWAYRADGWGA